MGIRAEDLHFSYGETAVLRGVSFWVEKGECIGIMGVSGGGKSTLLKLLSGLYVPRSGRVEVAGEVKPGAIRRQVAMVMQSAMLLPGSIRDNITCGHPIDEDRIRRAVEAAQLAKWVEDLPGGLDTSVGERGSRVSGGQAQRIAIARAILKDAPVVLLDEATSALDGETGGLVLEALGYLTTGRTVVSVTHRPETLIGCSRVYRLEGGRLYAS